MCKVPNMAIFCSSLLLYSYYYYYYYYYWVKCEFIYYGSEIITVFFIMNFSS